MKKPFINSSFVTVSRNYRLTGSKDCAQTSEIQLSLLESYAQVSSRIFLILHTPHFPTSAFSILRIFRTPHFLHSSFSILLIFHTPHPALSIQPCLSELPTFATVRDLDTPQSDKSAVIIHRVKLLLLTECTHLICTTFLRCICKLLEKLCFV